MFQPIEAFIGLRYLRSGRRRGVVSFMTGASFFGIALGVAALLVISSVLNGFETENRTRLLSMSEHIRVTARDSGIADWRTPAARIATLPGVEDVTPFVEIEGMLAAGPTLRPVRVRGIDAPAEAAATGVAAHVDPELLAALTPGSRRVILGYFLAASLGVAPGQDVNLWLPRVAGGRTTAVPAALTVLGTFSAGAADNDTMLALTSLADASALAGLGGEPAALAVRLKDPLAAPRVGAAVAQALGPGYAYSSWTERHRSLFGAMRVEKTMMTIILMFVVGVAAFNIVTSLMMIVNEKEKDIAILRTCGLEPARVVRAFVIQGMVIGGVGTLLGTLLGLVLASNVGVIVPWLEGTFGFRIMPGDVFYVTEIPAEIRLGDVLSIPLLALAISVVATIYPARRAAHIAPGAALRYE